MILGPHQDLRLTRNMLSKSTFSAILPTIENTEVQNYNFNDCRRIGGLSAANRLVQLHCMSLVGHIGKHRVWLLVTLFSQYDMAKPPW
jgi:hypothetical protein